MTEENYNNNNEVEKDIVQNNEEKVEETKSKSKFTFKCTQCDECCMSRGPIPITTWDIELWAKNGVIANFLPYLEIYNKPDGGLDLILKPILSKVSNESKEKQQSDPFTETPIEELLEEKCPMYNNEQKKCLIYENRPLSCRTYPLEFDGSNFIIVDENCSGLKEEGMTKEELKEMREIAKIMYYELIRIRIALPVLSRLISNNIIKTFIKQEMEVRNSMSEEDKAKLDEILQKGHQHSHEHDHTHD